MYKIITVQGPTASGKSKLALNLAEYFDIEIISADSRQVFKYLDIGTAKPSQAEKNLVPHHLTDIIEPDKSYNAGRFAKDASRAIIDITERGKIPAVCGGTGFYIKALTEGLADIPEINKDIKEEVAELIQKKGTEYLREKLVKIDQEEKKRIHPNDTNRIMRATEVYLQTGKPLSYYFKTMKPELNLDILSIYIKPERNGLYEKINKRTDKMMKDGLYEEFKNVLKSGYGEDSPGLNTVGYKELFGFYFGLINLDKSVELIKRNTRRYAKRQFTWFNGGNFTCTVDSGLEEIDKIIKKINSFKKD
ncbi:MAG: tRNA (adenosine(37)-N6)-dimethylallyltransferase MiaA [Candidatus Cloacimonadota bacterium]|nr:MAG: tRNA (adenosine(37)-N6)-dimethylallyltransferase MiaA [Candidatus Cloacimonadota bacterium]